MGRKNSNKKGNRKKNNKKLSATDAFSAADWNFLPRAGSGCHIARQDLESDWMLEWEAIDPEEFGGNDDDIPDLAVDTQDHTLTLCNVDDCYKVAYITVYESILRGRNGKVLTSGSTTDTKNADGNTQVACTTLIVLCPPCTFAHLCYLPVDISPCTLQLESDVQEWQQHPNPNDTHTQTIGFPLRQSSSSSSLPDTTSFLCTQGVGGCLTHFFAGNLHAIDFQCPIGTPVVAVGSGVVRKVKVDCHNTITGIGVTNLFSWHSIVLQLDADPENSVVHHSTAAATGACESLQNVAVPTAAAAKGGPLFIEYVHIETSTVVEGDRVVVGQVIGTSGSVGFSPEPHLHLAAYRTMDDTAPTCLVYFHASTTTAADTSVVAPNKRKLIYLPVAGHRYNSNGPVE